MRRCTLAIVSNAASIAASALSAIGPATLISTNVPSNGRARWMLSRIAIGGQNSFHAFREVQGRQGRTRNVADITADLEGARAGLADELRKPTRAAHFATVRFSIGKNIHPFDVATHN